MCLASKIDKTCTKIIIHCSKDSFPFHEQRNWNFDVKHVEYLKSI